MSETALWPFAERNGVDATEDVDSLLRDPEFYLDDAEKAAVYAFAGELFNGRIHDDLHVQPTEGATEARNLFEINNTSTTGTRQDFYVDYFKTEAAADDAAALGIDPEGDEPIREQLYRLTLDPDATPVKTRKQVAARSAKWYKQELADRLKLDVSEDAAQPDCEVVVVDANPQVFLSKFHELQAYRPFYRQVRRALNEAEPSTLNDARLLMLDLHVAKVNSMVAEMYPRMQNLARQLHSLPDSEAVTGWREELQAAAPVIAAMFEREEADREHDAVTFMRRLDLVRNGAAAWDNEHDYSPISHEVALLADELAQTDQAPNEDAIEFDPEMIEYLQNTKWGPDEMRDFCEKVLTSWSLLSADRATWEEVDDRSGYAADKKWQVIISDKVSSLSVNGKKKVLTVPRTFDRTLVQVAPGGVLPNAAHELSHIWQHEFSFALAQQIPLAGIKGKRHITTYEMGGINQERVVHDMVGQVRPTNVTYLRALQAKLQGANQTQVARAFAEAKGPNFTTEQAESAGKNILRLYRNGGYDSQALDYIEQELLARALSVLPSNEAAAISIAGGSFSLRDTAALHRFGLIELPRQLAVHPARDVVELYLRDYYYPEHQD